MKKASLLLLTASLFYTVQTVTLSQNQRAYIWLGAGTAAAVLKYTPFAKACDGVCEQLNTDTDDALSFVALAALLKGGSYFLDNKSQIKPLLSTLPLLGVVAKLVATSQWYNSFINHVPIVKDFFGCKHCKDICNRCKLKTGTSVFLISALLYLLDTNTVNVVQRLKSI